MERKSVNNKTTDCEFRVSKTGGKSVPGPDIFLKTKLLSHDFPAKIFVCSFKTKALLQVFSDNELFFCGTKGIASRRPL